MRVTQWNNVKHLLMTDWDCVPTKWYTSKPSFLCFVLWFGPKSNSTFQVLLALQDFCDSLAKPYSTWGNKKPKHTVYEHNEQTSFPVINYLFFFFAASELLLGKSTNWTHFEILEVYLICCNEKNHTTLPLWVSCCSLTGRFVSSYSNCLTSWTDVKGETW